MMIFENLYFQYFVATQLRCSGIFSNHLQIFHRMRWWKNFENSL